MGAATEGVRGAALRRRMPVSTRLLHAAQNVGGVFTQTTTVSRVPGLR